MAAARSTLMGVRLRWDIVTISVGRGWTREASGLGIFERMADVGPSRPFVLGSPRGEGRFHLETGAMPEDIGIFDCERLQGLVERPDRSGMLVLVRGEYFDRTAWFDNGIACIGQTAIWRMAATPVIQRDWYLACGCDMANAWYRGSNADHAAADIADCEDMVRSIRFDL